MHFSKPESGSIEHLHMISGYPASFPTTLGQHRLMTPPFPTHKLTIGQPLHTTPIRILATRCAHEMYMSGSMYCLYVAISFYTFGPPRGCELKPVAAIQSLH